MKVWLRLIEKKDSNERGWRVAKTTKFVVNIDMNVKNVSDYEAKGKGEWDEGLVEGGPERGTTSEM